MPIIIRYAWPEVGDSFICDAASCGVAPNARWQNGTLGRTNAKRFDSEGDAKSWLAENRFDLDPLKVTFEQVAR